MKTALLGVALVLSVGGAIVKAAEQSDPRPQASADKENVSADKKNASADKKNAAAEEKIAVAARDSDPQQHRINPLTGKALSLEHKQLQLEEAKLEEQLAAADFNRKKFQVEIKRLDAELSHVREPQAATLSLPLGPGNASVSSVDLATATAKRPVPRLSPGNGQTLAEVTRDGPGRGYRKTAASRITRTATPKVVGMMRSNGKDYALVDLAGQIQSVAAGDSVGGQRIGQIKDSGVVMGGVSHPIGPSVARVETTDRSRATLQSAIARGSPGARDLTALPLFPASSMPEAARTRSAGQPFDARLPEMLGR